VLEHITTASGAHSGVNYLSRTPGPGKESWPVAVFGSIIYRKRTMQDCRKAAALANFTYWSQTNTEALRIAERCCPLPRLHGNSVFNCRATGANLHSGRDSSLPLR
jgi:hypothetical protein